ncbi:Uncharacterized protein APZ42_024046 [Daphnia magna]|uniref:Uncharacterized protein n=1 Tax=Daphnia magna TaxID=35525 RepID=A0A164UD64_9CRUS|nr:Uncharacterized protein APZ42_024046 [Daphnia magna]
MLLSLIPSRHSGVNFASVANHGFQDHLVTTWRGVSGKDLIHGSGELRQGSWAWFPRPPHSHLEWGTWQGFKQYTPSNTQGS